MKRRWNTKNHSLPDLFSLDLIAPRAKINIHDIFDLLVRGHLRRGIDQREWQVIATAFELFGLDSVINTHFLKDSTKSTDDKIDSLFMHDDNLHHRVLFRLWRQRLQMSTFRFSWRHVLEGHPVTGGIPYREEWAGLAEIADDLVDCANKEQEIGLKIDLFILKMWGFSPDLPIVTANDIAKITDAIIDCNVLYDANDFDV